MNKKALKYVLIVSGIVLLLGLGIWGYKYIRDSKIIECNIQHILNKTSKDKNLWKIERICDFGYRFLCSDESVNC